MAQRGNPVRKAPVAEDIIVGFCEGVSFFQLKMLDMM